jgi:alpha-beta hydrolase superfamily lysophospholipase
MRKALKRLLVLFALCYLGVLAYIGISQRSLMYFPEKNVKELSEYNLGKTQETMLTTKDGVKIHAWYHLPSKDGMPMVIYLHGNSGHLGKRELKYKELIDMGYGLVAISWRGFGKSESEPSEEGLYNDARASVAFLKELGFKTEETIIIGESLGSGLAVKMATENQFKGVFLITPYTSISDRAQEIYWYLPVSALIQDNFKNLELIDQIHAPLLIVHGTEDDIIPHSHSEQLMEKALEPKRLIIYPSKGHNNLDTRELYNEMTKYFNIAEISGLGVRHFAQN